MSQEFTQTGGLRYGESFWYAANFTKPFAMLRVSRDAIVVSVSFFRFWQRSFTFQRSAIQRLRWRRGIFSLGLQVEHTVAAYPPFVLFWLRDRKALALGLRDLGYEISASN